MMKNHMFIGSNKKNQISNKQKRNVEKVTNIKLK